MDLKQAYELLRKEKFSLQNEVGKLRKTIDQVSSGSYEDPLKIKHLRQIRDLTWKNRSLQEEADRYHSLYSHQLEENARIRLENKELLKLNSKLQWQNDCYKNVHSDRSETAYEAAQEEIRSLKDEVARLRSLLGRNGSEAGIPTSKTPVSQKKIIPNSRTASGRKKGGQPGHKKCSMAPFSDDEITWIMRSALSKKDTLSRNMSVPAADTPSGPKTIRLNLKTSTDPLSRPWPCPFWTWVSSVSTGHGRS